MLAAHWGVGKICPDYGAGHLFVEVEFWCRWGDEATTIELKIVEQAHHMKALLDGWLAFFGFFIG